jgi:flagellar hook assembly protein FlgD
VKTPRGVPIVGQPVAVPPVFSPNGDGVNDRVLIQYQIRVLGVGVPHELTVYDLAGRSVRQLISEPGPAGVYEREWDGTDESGQRVLPGTYIYRVKLETGRGTQLGMGTLSVAY